MLLVNKSPLAPVVRHVVDGLNCGARKSRVLAKPVLDTPEEHEIFSHLKQHGWSRIPDSIGLDLRRRIQEECKDLQQQYHDKNLRETDRHKTIWNYLSDIRYAGSKPGENDPLVRYALSRPLLNVAASYLGEIPWLRYIILTESVFQPGNISYSQKWHLDFDDARMLKLFVYLSDVLVPEDGPFRMIGREATSRVRNSFFRRHLSDEEVFSRVSERDVVDMYGPGLSSFVVDTSRVYHCGSRMTRGHSRLLYTALFTGFPSIYPKAIDMFTAGQDSPPLVRQVLAPMSGAPRSVNRDHGFRGKGSR